MKKVLNILLFNLLLFFGVGCDTTEPPENKAQIALAVEDVSCTEAWLKVTAEGLSSPLMISIKKDEATIAQISNLNAGDTIIFIDSLLPNKTYSFQAVINENTSASKASSKVSATTLDTTSHDFVWETFRFDGIKGTSIFYDVAIVNENDIWAVGEIFTEDSWIYDSLGNWLDPYNAAHWNGEEWTLKRIYYEYNGTRSWHPITSLFVFKSNDIFFSNLTHWNGSIFESISINIQFPSDIHEIWGTSINDFYIIGYEGRIAHYDGKTWNLIQSGTKATINDIIGIEDTRLGTKKIFAAVSMIFDPGDQKILTIYNNKVDSLNWNIDRRVHTIWGMNQLSLYVGGGGVFHNKKGYWEEQTEIPLYYSRKVRGTDLNNIFAVGDFGLVAHFNGKSWKTYDQLSLPGVYLSVGSTENIVVITGHDGRNAVIIVGRQS